MQKLVITTITGGLLAASSAVAGDFSVPIQPVAPATAPLIAGTIGSLSAGYKNVYTFRGINSGNDLTETQLDLATKVGDLELSLGAWYGSIEDAAGSRNPVKGVNYDELDIYGAVAKDLGFATVSVGYIHYKYFNDFDDAQEVSFGISKELHGFSASLTYFWDVETDNDGYTELGLGKTFDFMNQSININLAVGYLVEQSGFSHATLSASYDVPFGQATLTPYVAQVWELDELETTAGGSQSNEFIGGLNLSVSF